MEKSVLSDIESKWQSRWAEKRLFEGNPDNREKKLATFPFPYLNGPLHLGHAFTGARVDVYARYHRMKGENVLFPFSWHVTGEPIAGVAERLKKGDEKQKEILLSSGVPEGEVEKFKDPAHMIAYYKVLGKEAIDRMGFSVDWRREFTTTPLTPAFSRFIEWQYSTLKNLGYVRQGTHPVVWCPHDQSPTGDHDRLAGEGVSPVEFTLLKFPFEGSYLVAATLRPETIFGVVNFWINPDAEYVKAEVDGESWIVSKEAAFKLGEQQKKVRVVEEFRGSALIGKHCFNPVVKNEVPIFPASFVDPLNATGVVMSVPSHAPFDYIALKDLEKEDGVLKKFGIPKSLVDDIQPVSLIKTEGFGEHPAIEVSKKLGVESQKDPKCEEATSEVYKKEFHSGVLKENTGAYAGMKVAHVKKIMVKDFTEAGIASSMWETAENVVCRCSTKCIVKILENQWFLAYGNPEWKEKAKECLKGMDIFPEDARTAFEYTIDWLEDKACARKGGLGTLLPWDREWKVETLSDSTVYMAYYAIAKHININHISAGQLTDEVFDLIFLGKGDAGLLAQKSGLGRQLLLDMKQEFEHWYPVDFRNSAKELIFNHLTFFIFHHTALFPKKFWPRAIGVNGMINVEGEKMSKSKGNFVVILDALKEFSADTVRLGLIYTAEGMGDPDWKKEYVKSLAGTLERFLEYAKNAQDNQERDALDRWMLSRLQKHISRSKEAYECMNTRQAIQYAFFEPLKDYRWYVKRGGKNVSRSVLEAIAKMSSPVIPHVCEEACELMGFGGFCSLTRFPEPDISLLNESAELAEGLVEKTVRDIEEIIRFKKITPKKIFLYVADAWKHAVYEKVLGSEAKNAQQIAIGLLRTDEFKIYGKDLIAAVNKYVSAKDKTLGAQEEYEALSEALDFLSRHIGCEVIVSRAESAEHDPLKKARNAHPGKPAIYIE